MGINRNIAHDRFPDQGSFKGKRVRVFFQSDMEHQIGGIVRRDDNDAPFLMIIELDDGRFVLSTECAYSLDRSSN